MSSFTFEGDIRGTILLSQSARELIFAGVHQLYNSIGNRRSMARCDTCVLNALGYVTRKVFSFVGIVYILLI